MEDKNVHIAEEIVSKLLAQQEKLTLRIRALYVFGSFGSSDFRRDSDIDLGLLSDRPLSASEKIHLIKALDLPGGHVVDLIDLLTVDLEMQDIIISERRRIYTAPDAKDAVEDYEHYVWVMYLTLSEDRKPIIDQILKTGIIYGPDYIEKGRIRKPLYKAH